MTRVDKGAKKEPLDPRVAGHRGATGNHESGAEGKGLGERR